MQQLGGLDTLFLHAETAREPMHIGPLLIYDVSTAPDGHVRFKDILRSFEQRLYRSPVFRRKLVVPPLNLDRPYWIEDEEFDIEFHVRHVALPKPGDWRQLCIQVARLHSRPLDRARPLWEAHVIEGLDGVAGLPGGSFAIFLKIHHAAVDGATGTEIIGAINDVMGAESPDLASDSWSAEQRPRDSRLLWEAYKNSLRYPLRTARLAAKTIPAVRRVISGRRTRRFTAAGRVERTRFNGPITPYRVFGAATFDLARIKHIKRSVTDATVNDVMLSVVGGALRQYLEAKQELPERTLIAGAPINVRERGDVGTGGNMVSMMSVPLHTEAADPVARLELIHASAVESKAYHNAVGAHMLTDVSNSLHSTVSSMGFRAASATGLSASTNPLYNTIVTNIPGPQVALFLAGAKLVRNFGNGPCKDNLGLFHVVTSYDGMITISFQACREMLPDPAFYQSCIQSAFAELDARFD